MIQLPSLLAPWQPWLSLFPPELAEPLGQFLLRLHPQIGPLRSTPARADALPEGVGSIVSRGPYERLLISEWAYADAEPDEFIRRAAGGELMFTGPEPAARQRSRRCLALFDTGPAQLGEPRLLHLALFILLARRAQEAGAVFEWGSLQRGPQLRATSDAHAIKEMLTLRTLQGASQEHMAAWAPLIDGANDDTWLIGGYGLKAPFPVRGQIASRRSMLADELEVSLTMHQIQSAFKLALPDSSLSIRLLRTPFDAVASLAQMRLREGRPSLKQPPRFNTLGTALLVPQLSGDIVVYQIPQSFNVKPGKPRSHPMAAGSSLLGAGVMGKSFSAVMSEGDSLRFMGFPHETFAAKGTTAPRPALEDFKAPPWAGRWLPIFFLRNAVKSASRSERWEDSHVLALDQQRQLVCWTRRSMVNGGRGKFGAITFKVLERDVIGAQQHKETLAYVCNAAGKTRIFSWRHDEGVTCHDELPAFGSQAFLGNMAHWPRRGTLFGLVALKIAEEEWWVGSSEKGESVSVAGGLKVLGVARCRSDPEQGLVVLAPCRKRIELRTASRTRTLVESGEEIAQASVCAVTGNIAWIGSRSFRIFVQAVDQNRPYLEVLPAETSNAA